MSDASRARERAQRFAPVAERLAGRRGFPVWALIHHRGRRTGAEYATPVAVVPTSDRSIVLIGLPYGLDTNWVRNVVAAGHATLTSHGRTIPLFAPRIVHSDEAAALARRPFRPVLRRMPGAVVLRRS